MATSKKAPPRAVLEKHENKSDVPENNGNNRYMSMTDLGSLIGKTYCDGCGFSGGKHAPACPALSPPAPPEIVSASGEDLPPLDSEPPFYPSDFRSKRPEPETANDLEEVGKLARAFGRAVLRGAARRLTDLARKLDD